MGQSGALPDREVVAVGDAVQRQPEQSKPSASEPLLDRATKFWLWMLGVAVLLAVAAVVVGVVIG